MYVEAETASKSEAASEAKATLRGSFLPLVNGEVCARLGGEGC